MTHPVALTVDDQAGAETPGLSAWPRLAWLRARARLATLARPHALVLLGRSHGLADVAATDAALKAFGAWCQAHQGSACELGLSSQWLLVCVAAAGETSTVLREQAMQQWAHYHGLDADQIASQWVLRELLVPEAAMLCAAPVALVDGLKDIARAHGVQLRGMVPWWVPALQAWCGQLSRQPVPDGGQGAQIAQGGMPSLALVEPGLVTHVQADIGPQGVQIARIWSEAVDAVSLPGRVDGVHHAVVTLPPPSDADGASAEWVSADWAAHLWAHASLRPVLRGDLFEAVPA